MVAELVWTADTRLPSVDLDQHHETALKVQPETGTSMYRHSNSGVSPGDPLDRFPVLGSPPLETVRRLSPPQELERDIPPQRWPVIPPCHSMESRERELAMHTSDLDRSSDRPDLLDPDGCFRAV
jgi:hypothetical protein